MKQRILSIIFLLVMCILIADIQICQQGMSEAVDLCIKTVIPSLFPFVFFSNMLTSYLSFGKGKFTRSLSKLLRIPQGCEDIWIIGAFGGYPMGAQCIGQALKNGSISLSDAKRMFCFSSNAGPAFIFGIGLSILGDISLCFLAWFIHLLSSILIGILTTGNASHAAKHMQSTPLTLTEGVKKSIATMAIICAWVVLFRLLITFLKARILYFLPFHLQMLIYGLLEMTNGCCMLGQIDDLSARFVLFSTFLSFGGLCVAMQTAAVTSGCGLCIGSYIWAKVAQTAISFSLSLMAAYILFSENTPNAIFLILPCIFLITTYALQSRKIRLEKRCGMMYNVLRLGMR